VLRLMALDDSLFEEAEGRLSPEDFSSPFLGKLYALFRQRWQEGREMQLGALAGTLTPEEMSQLTAIMQEPTNPANVHQALTDYINIIQKEKLKQNIDDNESLLAFRDKKRTEDTTHE
jgi:DNA primase